MLPVHPFTQSHFELVHIHDAHYMHRVVLIGLSMSFVIGEVFEMDPVVCVVEGCIISTLWM